MSSHNDPNIGDEEAEEGEMERIRARYAGHRERMDGMLRLPLGQRIEGGRRVRRVQEEEEYEEQAGGDMLGLGIPTLPPQPNLGKGKPFSPRRDFSGSSPFKRKREPQESPEMRRASAPSLRQDVFPQAPILGRAATDGFNRLMMRDPRGSQPATGLGLVTEHQRLRLGSQNQGLGFGGFEQYFDQPRQHDDSRQQPHFRDQPRGLGFGGFGQSMKQPKHQPLSGQQRQSLDQGLSFVWEPGADGLGSLRGFPPVNHIEGRRSRIAQLREGQDFAFGGEGGPGFLPAGFPPGRARPANLVAPPRQGPPFLPTQDLRSFGKADDDYDPSFVPSSSFSPGAARPPTRHLPTSLRPSTHHGTRTSGVASSNPHTRLPPHLPNNPWQNLPGFGNENEDEDEGDGDGNNALRISPNERRRRILGQQEFLPSFHQQVYSQSGSRATFQPVISPEHANNSNANAGMGRGRAPAEISQTSRARQCQESEQRFRHSRLNRSRFGDADGEEYDSDEFSRARYQASGVRQPGMGERGPIAGLRQPEDFGARHAVRPGRVLANFSDEEDEGDEDDEEGERLRHILASSARHMEEQSQSAHPFGHPARPVQQPERTATSSRHRSSSVSVHTSDYSPPEPIGPPQQSRQRVQRQPSFMQHTQAGRRRVSSGNSAGFHASRPSPRQSFIRRASNGVHRDGHLPHLRGRGGLAPAQRGRGCGAPPSMSPQPSLLSNHGNWSGLPQRPHRGNAVNPFAGRDMNGESSADEAPAPPQAAANASTRGRGGGENGVRGGRGRGLAHIQGSNARRPPAINQNYAPPGHQGQGRARDTSATNAMAGLGLKTRSRNEAPRSTATHPHAPHPYAPPDVQPTGYLDGRAVYPTADGGMVLMPNETIPAPPKPKVLSKLEQLRAQAALQMEAIQAQLKAAEEEALAEEAEQLAAQMEIDGADAEGGKRELAMEDIGEVEGWDEGEVGSEFGRSIKPIKMGKGKNKGKEKGKVRAPSGMMVAMKAAARAMGLEGDDELGEGGGDRDRDRAHNERDRGLRMPELIKAANRHFGVRNEDSEDEEEDDDEDIDEYEADLMTEDEDEMDGERMAREAQRILDEQRAAELGAMPDPNIDPRMQAQPSPCPPGTSLHMIPPHFQHAERGLDPDDPVAWITDNDVEANRQQQEHDDITMAGGNDEGYEEYDSEWEEDPTGYDDAAALAAALAALARPAANVADTYSAMDAFGIQANPTHLALSLSLKRGFTNDDPDLIPPQITNWSAPRKKTRGSDGKALVPKKTFTFFESLGEYPELIFELCKHMDPKDLLTLYGIQKDFHETVNGHITHVVKSCARYYAAESARVYPHEMYKSLCIRDPAMRKNPRNWGVARWVPGLKWLQMVAHRERTVRDILACLARAGHRMPKSMPLTVKKIWLIMDIATTAQRISLCHNETWLTDIDCYNAQFFIIKLLLMLNEPMSQHGDDGMIRVFLGQRGLTPLCKLLKREKYLNDHDILKLCSKYSYYPAEEHKDLQMFGVKPEDIGKGHLEGWGKGKIHLFRIDEIVMRESTRRKLNLDDHLLYMMLWGHVDPETGKDIEPSYEEMYMSDEEDVERKRQMDHLEKLRSELVKEGREIIREDYRAQKRKQKKAKHEKRLLSHKQMLAMEYAEKGYREISVEEWDKQAEVDEERANWFMDYNHPQRSMSANDVPFYLGEKTPDAVDYFDMGDSDIPDDEVISAYEPLVYDSDGDHQASSLPDHALVNLVSPGHSASESEYEAFDEVRKFDPTQEWSRDDENHPGESLTLNVRDTGAIGESGWVKNHKRAEDEFGDPVEEDEWWCTTSEESGEGDDDNDDL